MEQHSIRIKLNNASEHINEIIHYPKPKYSFNLFIEENNGGSSLKKMKAALNAPTDRLYYTKLAQLYVFGCMR